MRPLAERERENETEHLNFICFEFGSHVGQPVSLNFDNISLRVLINWFFQDWRPLDRNLVEAIGLSFQEL